MAGALLGNLAATAVQPVVNRLLALDPAARQAVAALAGRRARLTLTQPALTLTLAIDAEGMRVLAVDEAPADVTVTAAPEGVLAALHGEVEDAVLRGSLVLEGDEDLARRLFAVFGALRPDLEAPLAAVLGDTAAHAAGDAARRSAEAACSAAAGIAGYGRERLTEAGGPLPARHEVARFFDEVDDLRLASDRLEARIARLRATTRSRGNGRENRPENRPENREEGGP